jgi:hypothetical protein
MRLRELINERKEGKLTKRQKEPTRGVSVYSDAEKANSDYVAFKLGQAMAGTDGKLVPDIDSKSWFGKKKTIHPYTEVEHEMFVKASKAVGANFKDLNKGDMRSLELKSTNTVSPVAKPKKNKYGV